MPLTQLAPPYPIFTDKNGDPLDAGYLYFGEPNLNPETNPIQVYYDRGLTQPVAQPVRTSNGYIMRNGSPALIYADSQFSVTVRNKNNELVIYSPVGFGVTPGIPFAVFENSAKDVADLLADTQFTYSAGIPNTVQVAAGDILRTLAEGLAYEVAASGATDQHVTTAGGVKLYVLPTADWSLSLVAFGALGDNSTDDRTAILTAIDAANSYWSSGLTGSGGARIIGSVGARYVYSGRIRLRPGVTIDLGKGASSALLIAKDANGGIEQVAGSGLRGELRTSSVSFTGPMLELDAAKSTELGFGRNDRAAWFDVGIRANRTAGSRGLVLRDAVGSGVAWVRGYAEVGECDYGCELISEGTGYVNENWIDLAIYDAVESLRMTVAATGEVAANRITLTAQTGANLRSGIVIRCDGRRNFIDLTSWDWETSKLNPAYDGTQVLLTAASGGNVLRGTLSRGLTGSGFSKPCVVDIAPQIRRNIVQSSDQRVVEPNLMPVIPNGYVNFTMTGDQDDELAFAANGRWTVTGGGATPPSATSLARLFQPNGAEFSVSSATECTVLVDFGSSQSGSDYNGIGVIFSTDAGKPDKIKIESSTDNVTWTTMLTAGYDGGIVPPILHRMDGGGFSTFRYLRLTAENNTAKTMRMARWFLSCHGTAKTGGAWPPKYQPQFLGRVNVQPEFGGDGYFVNGTQVVTVRQAAIPNAAGGTEIATINAILTALRAHGLIAP
jgi:hypothetical protein